MKKDPAQVFKRLIQFRRENDHRVRRTGTKTVDGLQTAELRGFGFSAAKNGNEDESEGYYRDEKEYNPKRLSERDMCGDRAGGQSWTCGIG
jgi:hypothetical protein